MSVIYLTEQGGYLHKSGDTITFEKEGEKILQHPMKDISVIVLFGNIQVSVQAMLALLEAGCDISMLTQDGHFRGKMVSAFGKNAPLRQKQWTLSNDAVFCLDFARRITTGKIQNGVHLLRRYTYSNFNPVTAERIQNIESILEKITQCTDMDSLRGFEGSAARLYFEDFGRCLTGDIPFTGRKFHPAPDPVNALLSFGYSFIAREIQGIMEALGLDPYIGFFHQIQYGRASLSLDLAEEFRHALVDRLTLRLLNKKVLTADDFYIDKTTSGYYLKRESLKVFLRHFEEYMDVANITYRGSEGHTLRAALRKQVEHLKSVIENGGIYQPFILP